jgi:hypothetical protein
MAPQHPTHFHLRDSWVREPLSFGQRLGVGFSFTHSDISPIYLFDSFLAAFPFLSYRQALFSFSALMLRWGHRFLLGQKVAPLPPPPASPKFPANRPALLLSHLRRSSSRKRNTHGARSEYHGTQPNLRYSGKVYINQPMQVKKQHKMPHQHRLQPPPQSHSMTMIPGLTLLAAEQAREQALQALK